MSFNKWSGLESDFTHEHLQINELAKILKKWSNEKNKNVHLLTNYYVGGEEIDATIILSNTVVVIDLKSGSGKITGGENGDWDCLRSNENPFIINKNRKNPYLQARDKRFAVIDYLNEHKNEIFSSQKASQMDFIYTTSLVVFDGKVEWDKEQLPVKVLPWFDVLSLSDLTEKLESIRNKKLLLTTDEAIKIPTILKLTKIDNEHIKAEVVEKQTTQSSVKTESSKKNNNFKYAIGIDLGTTVSSLCYIDLDNEPE